MNHARILLLVSLFGAASAHRLVAYDITPSEQKELLEKAEEWLVPQPSPAATLIKIQVFSSNGTDFYALGFVEPDEPGRALVGFQYRDASQETKAVPSVSDPSLDDVSPTSPFFGANFGLVTGIQLIRRGNDKIGQALIAKALGKESGHPHSPFYSPAGEPPVRMLARSCLMAALNEITSPKPDFANIKRRVNRLLEDQPELKNETTEEVLAGLNASVAYQPAREGTIERIVDDYLMSGGRTGALCWNSGDFSEAERSLILKGFSAVPALLAQRHSKRFTNHLMQGFNNFPSYPMNAGQVVDEYLQRLANSEFESDWLNRQKGIAPEDDAVLSWWKEASARGEEVYIQKYTIWTDGETARASQVLLLLATERYPRLLPDIYRATLKTSTPSWTIAEAIMKTGAIPNNQKVELFKNGIETNHEAHRNTALRELRKLDAALADDKLVQVVTVAPNTVKEAYWTDHDANLGFCIAESADPRIWQALHKLLDRADLGMRMELIHHLFSPAPRLSRSQFEFCGVEERS